MNRTSNRRTVLKGAAGFTAALLLPRMAAAKPGTADLYRRAIIIDCNLMTPLDPDAVLDQATADQVRASGLTALKMTIGGANGTLREAEQDIADFDRAMFRNGDLYLKINGTRDIATAKTSRRIGVIYSFEAASMLDGAPANVDHFAALGVRVMGLSYNIGSPFASGTMSAAPASGLTALGREAIARMNAVGVTLDLSHSDELTSLDAVTASRCEALITHAGCAAVYRHPRNKSDRLLRAIADKGGVVGIYELSYLSSGPDQQSMNDYLAHLTHALKICGEDHVGIGSDALLTPFDTSPAGMADWNKSIEERKASGVAAPGEGRPPFVTGLNRPDRIEIIAEALARRGLSSRVIEKVLGANFLRVFNATWSPA